MQRITVQKLTKTDFAPFGDVLHGRDRDPDIQNTVLTYRHNEIDLKNFHWTSCGLMDVQPRGTVIKQLQRLPESDEGYFSVDANISAIPVAAHDENTGRPNFGKLRVFLIEKGMGVLVRKNVWHSTPVPADKVCSF